MKRCLQQIKQQQQQQHQVSIHEVWYMEVDLKTMIKIDEFKSYNYSFAIVIITVGNVLFLLENNFYSHQFWLISSILGVGIHVILYKHRSAKVH